jgi:hypothetical protein
MLEQSLNQMGLGHDVIIEDSNLMISQMTEIAYQLTRANKVMKASDQYVSNFTL